MTSKKGKAIFDIINRLISILPVFFWVFLIFGFEEPCIAIISIVAALVHEGGHILYILWRRGRLNFKGVLSGFRIKPKEALTYSEEIMTYAAGPLTNLTFFLLFSFLAPAFGSLMWEIAIINFATAVSNLMPIEGYDGYGVIRAYLEGKNKAYLARCVLKRISSALTFFLCIISLYMIDRMGGGYWIFGVFFISTIKCIKDDLG